MIYCPTIIAQLHKLYTDSSQQTCALYKAAGQLTEVFNVWAAEILTVWLPDVGKCVFTRRGEEASPSIGNTLWRVWTMFTRSAITPPNVNGFGWNLGSSEYIAWSCPWQILGATRTEARAAGLAEILLLSGNNAGLCRFPVSQISRNLQIAKKDVVLRRGEFFRNRFVKNCPQGVFSSKNLKR